MAVDYDLVILGGTLEGRRAAIQAARYGARVALVEVPGLFEANQRQRYLLQALQQLGQGLQRQAVGQWFGFGVPEGAVDWQAVLEWCAIAAETQLVDLSAEVLGRQGVDVVMEVPERLSRDLVVTTASRRVRSRGVLAAFGLAPDALEPLMRAEALPNSVMVLGGNARAIEWATAMSSVGVAVTLQAAQVLPGWDVRIQGLVRSQLITKGVRLNGIRITEPHNNLVNSQSVNAQSKVECTLPLDTESPALSLPQFVYGSKDVAPNYLNVNNRLQSAHPRVFACGPLLGGSADQGLANYEADLAVKNALFLPKYSVDEVDIVQQTSQFAQAGLTEDQAQQRYGKSIRVWATSCADSADLSGCVLSQSFCKLVCCENSLVGIHLFGAGASEVVQGWSRALGKNLKNRSDFSSFPCDDSSLGDLVCSTIGKSHQDLWQINDWRRDWSENWFNWRRSSQK